MSMVVEEIEEFEETVELRERRSYIGELVGSEDAEELLPPEPGIYECICERCKVGPDETSMGQLEMVLRPEGYGPKPGRLWFIIKLMNGKDVTELRRTFAAAGHQVLSRADLRSACDAVLGQRFVVELLKPEGGYNGSDRIKLLRPANGAAVDFPAKDPEHQEIGHGSYDDYDDIPRCGGDYKAPASDPR